MGYNVHMTDITNTNEEIDKIAEGLTMKEIKFVDLVLRGEPVGFAYAMADLSAYDEKDEKNGKFLLESPRIKLYIDSMKRMVATRSVMTLAKIDERLTDIAMTDVTDVVEIGETCFPTGPGGSEGAPVTMVKIKNISELPEDKRCAISSIKPCSGGLEVKLHDKVKVMEILAKRRGGFKDVQEVQHTGRVEVFAMVGNNGRGPKSDK